LVFHMLCLRPILLVFLPFAAGYYLSYLFRLINAVLARSLTDELAVGAAQLGLLTSIYFLAFAATQLPVGAALDRFGPRRTQAALLLLASVGAVVSAQASSFTTLAWGRGLIGIGVAGALIAGLKALSHAFPRDRLPLVNGAFTALGAAGAVTATAPVEWLLTVIDWRELFLVLAAATAGVALLTLFIVAEPPIRGAAIPGCRSPGFRAIYADRRFWRLAPLSALCIGSAWSLQGLWAASWLADVAGLDRVGIVQHLFVMALALCVGALLFGTAAHGLRRRGIGPQTMLSMAALIFIVAQLTLVFGLPLPSFGVWATVAAMGAATVLSYALVADLFPRESVGRANAALNVLHISAAFIIQSGIGFVVELWPQDTDGRYPAAAYDTALALISTLQVAALVWFLWSPRRDAKSLSLHHETGFQDYGRSACTN
jgi:MFS family permease